MTPKIATHHDDDYAGGEADPEDLFFGRNVRFHLLRDWVQPVGKFRKETLKESKQTYYRDSCSRKKWAPRHVIKVPGKNNSWF